MREWWVQRDGTELSEQERWDTVAPLLGTLKLQHSTMKEALDHMVVLAKLNGWKVLTFPTAVAFQYGKYEWECIYLLFKSDGHPLYDYHNPITFVM